MQRVNALGLLLDAAGQAHLGLPDVALDPGGTDLTLQVGPHGIELLVHVAPHEAYNRNHRREAGSEQGHDRFRTHTTDLASVIT